MPPAVRQIKQNARNQPVIKPLFGPVFESLSSGTLLELGLPVGRFRLTSGTFVLTLRLGGWYILTSNAFVDIRKLGRPHYVALGRVSQVMKWIAGHQGYGRPAGWPQNADVLRRGNGGVV